MGRSVNIKLKYFSGQPYVLISRQFYNVCVFVANLINWSGNIPNM